MTSPVPYRSDAQKALFVLFAAMVFIIVLVAAYAAQINNGWAVFAGGCLVAIGAFAIGALLGLLFGVPHAGDPSATTKSTWALIPNTSLDQISDWLTKILVGVGLTQLLSIPSRLQELGGYLAPTLGGTATSAGFSVAVVLSSSVVGFMACFVWTKLVLSPDLAEAGKATDSQQISAAVTRVAHELNLPLDQQVKAAAKTAEFADQIRLGDPNHIAQAVGIPAYRIAAMLPVDWDQLVKKAVTELPEDQALHNQAPPEDQALHNQAPPDEEALPDDQHKDTGH
jgi:hypothetical protein